MKKFLTKYWNKLNNALDNINAHPPGADVPPTNIVHVKNVQGEIIPSQPLDKWGMLKTAAIMGTVVPPVAYIYVNEILKLRG